MDIYRILKVIQRTIKVIPDLIGDLLYNIYIFARGSKIILLSGEFF